MMSSISCLLKSSLMSFKWLTHCSLNWTQICLIIVVLLSIESSDARKHHLVLNNDGRKYFTVSTFGFLTGGTLTVEVKQFSAQPFNKDAVFGLTMAKTMSDSLTPYLDRHEEHCLLLDDVKRNNDDNIGLVSMRLDFKNNKVVFNCNEMLSKLRLFELLGNKPKRSPVANGTDTQTKSKANKSDDKDIQIMPAEVTKQPNDQQSAPKVTEEPKPRIDENKDKKDDKDIKHVEEKVNSDPEFDKPKEIKASVDQPDTKEADKSCSVSSIKLSKSGEEHFEFSFKFQAIVIDELHEGLYSLFFHNCPNYQMGYGHSTTRINLSMFITEQNFDNYLSAGEIPLPQLYFALSVIFFLVGVVWIHVIRNKKNDAFKIHYLMAGLVFVKAFALLFHGINYHFIAKEGSQVETWAILYYITHLLKGALLFITIVLIGTGWAFIKHILSDKDKKIFMIVIPLQVLANIADIIIEESEEGEMMHNMWREIFILVDLLCCGAILFPIVWSIRHLQEASQTDGKAAINLRKLKLFRHFYVMIVCYIYFTRIIVYLLQITMPFQYEWLDIFFRETATLLFFIMTGYHFQPTSTNPYFQLTQEEENEEMEEVLFVQPDNGYSETKKRNRDIEANSDSERLITKRESSHDFD